MELVLPCSLHARPANALVRVAARFKSQLVLRKGTDHAAAKNILEVLALGAAGGDTVLFEATGSDAEEALAALRTLVESCFEADRVPETGSPAVPGIAVGAAVVLLAPAVRARRLLGSVEEERARVDEAFARSEREIAEVMAHLPASEAELLAPEVAILRALFDRVVVRMQAGEAAEAAVVAETEGATTDLLPDARARLLDALSGGNLPVLSRALSAGGGWERVVVTGALTPSLIATLPDDVVGVLAALDDDEAGAGMTAHAVILARGRGLPIVYVPSRVLQAIADGDTVVIDATREPASVWIDPSETLVDEARARRQELARVDEEAARQVTSLAHLGIGVYVNIGSLRERVPAGAEGVGLLRTELLFPDRSVAPSEAEQLAAILAVVRAARGAPVVVRLFDGGGDKPLRWLPSTTERGVELLFRHHEVLNAQLRAIARAREHGDVRALVPMVRSEDDMTRVRALANQSLPLGAMIETPEAVARAGAIAQVADSLSVGTNDLAAQTLGIPRADAALTLDARVLSLVVRVIAAGHERGRRVSMCGEIAGDPRGARVLVGLGADALSMAPPRLGPIVRSLAEVSLEECRALARDAVAT
ncbi:MAG: HPr family phosphocarrier protein [Myxococcota bacterium]|nr:HPr family phosphocarrier protein [Myxococcota bacterium]